MNHVIKGQFYKMNHRKITIPHICNTKISRLQALRFQIRFFYVFFFFIKHMTTEVHFSSRTIKFTKIGIGPLYDETYQNSRLYQTRGFI